MHSPPSVRYPVGRSRIADRLLGACWLSGTACAGMAAIGLASQGTTDWHAWTPCAAALLSGLSLWRAQRWAIMGELAFDGGAWSLASAADVALVRGRARVCLDLQRLVLLRIKASGRPGIWLWVDRDADRVRWRDLRRALYTRVGTVTDAGPRRRDGRIISA